VALFLNGALILTAVLLYGFLGNEVPPFPQLGPGLLVDFGLSMLILGLINGEEIGWRGFALPRLQQRWGIVGTVIVLGTLETLFHLPIFFNNGASDAGGQNGVPFLAFLASSMTAVFLLTWVYNHTRGSLLIAYLFHASMNTWSQILPFPSTSPSFFWLLAVAGLVASAIVLVLGGISTRTSRPSLVPALATS
jgi:membrane protease YdiL (CAAX protease family)